MSHTCKECRRRDREGRILGGLVGGGYLLVGFGVPWAIVGMILGGLAGYCVSRQAQAKGES